MTMLLPLMKLYYTSKIFRFPTVVCLLTDTLVKKSFYNASAFLTKEGISLAFYPATELANPL